MENNYRVYMNDCFRQLIDVYGFKENNIVDEGQVFSKEFFSNIFVIKIEKYFREFYVYLYLDNVNNYEINLFNLLDFLIKNEEKKIQSNFFRNEKDIHESYKKQLKYMSSVIYENFDLLKEFFRKEKYELNIKEFEKYWRNKYPEFYN